MYIRDHNSKILNEDDDDNNENTHNPDKKTTTPTSPIKYLLPVPVDPTTKL